MSEVWRGFDERLERPVALKVVHARRRLDPLARARFLREARILGSLEHPGICTVFDLVEEGGEDVLVLELVEGEPLSAAMARGLDREQQLAVAEGIPDALAAAHRLGIVHRDLKPHNVMCTASGGVKVLDFDLAHRVGEATVDAAREGVGGEPDPDHGSAATPLGSLVGTVAYMSPEQAAGEALTTASDLYSLGLILHELFTARRAYPDAPTLEARLLMVGRAETLPVVGVEPDLQALVEALEERDPEQRPPAEEVVRRLRALRQAAGRRRRRRVAAAAGAVAAVAAATWLGLPWLERRAGRLDVGRPGRPGAGRSTPPATPVTTGSGRG